MPRHSTAHYSDHSSLNTIEVCQLDESSSSSSSLDKLWIVYIHGGAWRDPRTSSADFHPAQSLLLGSRSTSRIAGLASLNYRLSPYPEFPSDDPSRTAVHPDHIHDVLDAISYLQRTYSFGSNYVLVGHSAGATLAMQVAMSRAWSKNGPASGDSRSSVIPPIAIVGVCGIYDIPALLVSHTHPIYRIFIESAFGEQTQSGTDVWTSVSPTSGDYGSASWPGGRYVLLAHGSDDELIGWTQVELMERALLSHGWTAHGGGGADRTVEVLPLSGAHDEIWQKGHELSRAIETCLQRLSTSP